MESVLRASNSQQLATMSLLLIIQYPGKYQRTLYAASHPWTTTTRELTCALQTCAIPEKLPFDVPAKMRVLRRCTLILSDPSQNHRLSLLAAAYDIFALRPVNEKSLQQACASPYCDIVSIDLTQRFEKHFKFKMLSQAVENGTKIEICYAPGMLTSDSTARRNLISNATQLIRACRNRGLIISSGATRAIGCRGPADVINLAAVWGLGPERGKEAIEKLARSAVVTASIKRTSFRGVVDVIYGGEKPKATQSSENTQANGSRKRAADDTEGILTDRTAKPLSKSQQKKRRKAASEQAQKAAETGSDVHITQLPDP